MAGLTQSTIVNIRRDEGYQACLISPILNFRTHDIHIFSYVPERTQKHTKYTGFSAILVKNTDEMYNTANSKRDCRAD